MSISASYIKASSKKVLDHLVRGHWVASLVGLVGLVLVNSEPLLSELTRSHGFWRYVNDKIISFNELEPSTLTYFYTEPDTFADLLPHYSSLTGLYLENNSKKPSFTEFAQKLVAKMTGLTHLLLTDTSDSSSYVELCQSIALLTNLQLLSIYTGKKNMGMTGQIFTETLAALSQLQVLNVASPLLTTNTFLLPPTMFQLETLIIGCDETFCDHQLLRQLPLMTCLANLTLHNVTDSALQILTYSLPPNLSSLELIDWRLATKIPESTVHALGSALQSLPLVHLRAQMTCMDTLFAGLLPGLANSRFLELPPYREIMPHLPQLLPIIPQMTSLQKLDWFLDAGDDSFLPLFPACLEMAKKATHLRHLALEIPQCPSPIEFLQSFLHCRDLEVLNLCSFPEFIMPPVSWPSLRHLQLTDVRISDVKTLVLAHPLLEVLKFDCDYSEAVLELLASVPHLQELELRIKKPAMDYQGHLETFMISFGELMEKTCWRKMEVRGPNQWVIHPDQSWCRPSSHLVYCQVDGSLLEHPQMKRNQVRAKTLVDYHNEPTVFSSLLLDYKNHWSSRNIKHYSPHTSNKDE